MHQSRDSQSLPERRVPSGGPSANLFSQSQSRNPFSHYGTRRDSAPSAQTRLSHANSSHGQTPSRESSHSQRLTPLSESQPGFHLIYESSSDWSFVLSNEHHKTPPKLSQSQLPMSKSCSTASPKPYISKKDVATQVTQKQMARLFKLHSRE